MKKSMPKRENSSSDYFAELRIVSDSSGQISFLCDWSDDEISISYLSNIFSILGVDGLADKIIKDLRKSTDSQEDIQQIDKILLYYNAIKSVKKQSTKTNENEIIITPIDAASLI